MLASFLGVLPILTRRLTLEGSQLQASQGKKVYKTLPHQKKNWAWWHVPIIPASAGSLKEKNHGPG
jgi:hypothetical protein